MPVGVWVGPVGQQGHRRRRPAGGGGRPDGMAPGSSIEVTPGAARGPRASTASDLGAADVGDRVGAGRAVELGLVDNDAPTILEYVVQTRRVRDPGGRRPAPARSPR